MDGFVGYLNGRYHKQNRYIPCRTKVLVPKRFRKPAVKNEMVSRFRIALQYYPAAPQRRVVTGGVL